MGQADEALGQQGTALVVVNAVNSVGGTFGRRAKGQTGSHEGRTPWTWLKFRPSGKVRGRKKFRPNRFGSLKISGLDQVNPRQDEAKMTEFGDFRPR
jgi:hypothetical protein